MSRHSYTSGGDKFALAGERSQFQPPSYDYAMSTSAVSFENVAPQTHVMRDEERYPTVVEPEQGLHPYVSTDTHPILRNEIGDTMSPVSRNLDSLQKPQLPPAPAPAPRTYFGISRPRFIRIASIVLVAVLVAIIIGVVVGLKLRNKPTKYPAITSSGVFLGTNNTDWNMHVIHTNMTTGKVTFRLNTGAANWTAEKTMNLSIVPALNAPLSAASVLGNDGNVYINLFYIKDRNIVLANVSCVFTTCKTIYNGVITKNVTYPLASDSGLDSVYNNGTGYHVFYHNSDRYVTQLTTIGDGSWDHGETISGKALTGSSLSAALVGNSGAINVLYVDDRTKTLFNVQWDTVWQNPTPVSTTAIAQWSPYTALTSSWQPTSDILRAYFTGTDKFIYQLSSTNASSADFAAITRGNLAQNSTSGISTAGWSTPFHDLSWIPSEAVGAGISSLAWLDEVRLYRIVAGRLTESRLIANIWSAQFI